MMRACTKCGEAKPLEGYYKHPFGANGHQSRCIECTKAGVRANRAARLEYYRAYDRSRAKQPDRAEARQARAKLDRRPRPETDPIKRAARVELGNAVRDRRVLKPAECEVCAIPCNTHGHHDDYSKPLDVIWVCTPCHGLIHAYWRAMDRKAA